MLITLTDLLTCPVCGPEFGLVLLADRIENRRVLEGWLGCAECRERYRVRGGFVDFTAGEGSSPGPAVEGGAEGEGGGRGGGEGEGAIRIAALVGIREGPAFVVARGP